MRDARLDDRVTAPLQDLTSDRKAQEILKKLNGITLDDRQAAFLLLNEISEDLEETRYDLVPLLNSDVFTKLFELVSFRSGDEVLALTTTWSNFRIFLTFLQNSQIEAVTRLKNLELVPLLVNEMDSCNLSEFRLLCVTVINELLEQDPSLRGQILETNYLQILSELDLCEPASQSWLLLSTRPEFDFDIGMAAVEFLIAHASEPVTPPQIRLWKAFSRWTCRSFPPSQTSS